MKIFTPSKVMLICASMLFFSLQPLHAQTGPWDLLSDLLGQMDEDESQNFMDLLNELGDDFDGDLGGANEAFDELFDALGDDNPAGELDFSFIDVWGPGFDLLAGSLPGSGLDPNSQDTILDIYSNLNNIFNTNFDSLDGAFGLYQGDLHFDTENWDVVVVDGDEITKENLEFLENNFDMNIDPENPGNIGDIIGELFNVDIFPDLELAFGIQEASLGYWGADYEADAKVIRVGSVPSFDEGTGFSQQFQIPVEARWHMQASFLSKEDIHRQGDANLAISLDDFDGFSPLLFRGDYAVMAIPIVGTLGSTVFRFITSLGMEAGTYAPAHRVFNGRSQSSNKGFSTGFGPQVGTGFSVKAGDLTMYSIATISSGQTLKSATPYKYNSSQIEAGIRFSNIINVRYTRGKTTWQPDNNRYAKVNHQVTVGIILQELHL